MSVLQGPFYAFLLVFNSVLMAKPAYAEEETNIIETDEYEITEDVSDDEEIVILESDEEEIEGLSIPEQETESDTIYYPQEMTFQSDEKEDNEELVKGYINSLLYDRLVEMEKPTNLFDGYEIQGKKENGNKLRGANAVFYNQLSAMISKVAAGEIVSTEFSIDSSLLNLTKTSWTAEELGVNSIIDQNQISEEAQNAVNEAIGFDFDLLMNTLLADHPYELYWYDKTRGVSLVSGYSADETSLYIGGSFVFYFSTAYEYAVKVEDNQYKLYEIDPSTGNTIGNALAKADNIVNTYSGKNDLEKLYAYKNEICQMVDYNSEAVEYNQQYGNPWQLIWVFDENSSTKVVCEGYSKAFQYLCDLTDFEHDDICAYVVTGLMGGGTGEGNHMWNIVRMDDYKNYLVDVTNCDEGSIGEEDKLFLVGTENAGNSIENGYTFSIDGTSVTYKYDEITKRIYKSNELELANGTYSGSSQYSPTGGVAYAVLTSEGDLIFFRSFEEYENGKEYTVKDIKNEQFTGKVYTGIETVEYNYFDSVNVPWSEDASKIKHAYVSEGQTIKPLSLNGWFMLTKSLIDVNLKGIDSSLVEDMSVMFAGSAIESVDLSCLDTSNVTNMYWTFRECRNLKSVNFGIDTSKVNDMGGLFSRCSKLEAVDLSSLDTSSLKDISGLFSECSSLKSVTFGNFDTSSVTDISWLFQDCTAIRNIDLSTFKTSAVKNMNGMFKGCSVLEKIDISGFDTSSVTMMSNLFNGCDSLKTVTLGSGFTNWISDAYLPSGTWTNGTLVKTEIELYKEYPVNSTNWAGEWRIKTEEDDEGIYGEIVDQKDREEYRNLSYPTGFWTSSLHSFTYDPSIKSYVFNDDELRVYHGNKLLTQGLDYSIKYVNNNKAASSSAAKAPSLTITGKGNYTGTLTKTYDIEPLSVSESDVVILLNKESFAFNKKAQKPNVSSVLYKGVKLKNNTDYAVSYENASSTEEGSYRIILDLKGNYRGQLHASYVITASKTPISSVSVSSIKAQTYTGRAITPSVIVKAGKEVLSENSDYTLSYKDNIDAGTAYVIIKGIGKYDGTLTKSFKINGLPLNKAKVSGLTNMTYTGSSITLDSVSLSYQADKNGETKTLVLNKDYTLSYKNNIKAGNATITFKGMGGYAGTLNKTFKITKARIGLNDVSLDKTGYEYLKGGVKPQPVVTVKGKKLVCNVDYSLSYKNNSKLGTAILIVKGKGNYEGSVEKTFTISSKPLSKVSLILSDKLFTGKTNAWKSNVVLTDSDGKNLSANSDYNAKTITYTYEEDTMVLDGSSKEKVKPEVFRAKGSQVVKSDIPQIGTKIRVNIETAGAKTNSYTGSISGTYRIVPADLSKASVKIPVQYYSGKPVTLSKSQITVTLNKAAVPEDGFEIVSYFNNTAKGTAKVTIRGTGNYGGTKTVSFSIKQRSLGVTIRFDGNGATSGSMYDQIFYKDGKLSKNAFKKTIMEDGISKTCTFLGWSTRRNSPKPDYRDICICQLKTDHFRN